MTDTVNVPREPTSEMLDAAVNRAGYTEYGPLVPESLIPEIWRAMIAAAPKVEQEPVAWRYRTAPHRQWHFTSSRMDAGYEEEDGSEVQPLYTHPAPASDELLSKVIGISDDDLEALRSAANLEYYAGLDKWGEALERIYRRLSSIAKHKGPQS